MVSAGDNHSCGVRSDGTLACWGANFYGESAPPAGTFTQVAAGSLHSCGVRTGGALACWSYNANGQSSPPSGTFTAVTVGQYHSCGLRTDGTVACWGFNGFGQSPPPAGAFTAIEAGGFRTCGVRSNATIACWDASGPLEAPIGPFTAVDAATDGACGVRPSGSLVCWGLMPPGEPPPGRFKTVSTGDRGSCGERVDGVFQCWGLDAALGEPFGLPGRSAPPGALVVLDAPARVMDTRSPDGHTVDGKFQASGRIPAGATSQLTVAGRADIPLTAATVALNVTVAGAGGDGFLIVFPCGAPVPDASNVNFVDGQTVANAVLAKVGTGGKICLYSSAPVDAIVDITWYFPDLTGFVPLAAPARTMDTRSPGGRTLDGRFQRQGRVAAATVFELVLAGRAGLPLDASAVALNVTVAGAGGVGFLTVFPCGDVVPDVSSLNFVGGQTIPNAVLVKLSLTGTVCLYSSAATDVIVDVTGYFPDPSAFVAMRVPRRLADTRSLDARVTSGSTFELLVAGRSDVPYDASSVALNVTAVGAGGDGYVTVYPCGAPLPDASNLNFVRGQTVPNAVLAKVGTSGKICVYSSATTDVMVDVTGFSSSS
jgi:Regulator of chromosome condensation (RCC1) repeat